MGSCQPRVNEGTLYPSRKEITEGWPIQCTTGWPSWHAISSLLYLTDQPGCGILDFEHLCRQGGIKVSKPGGRDWFIPDEKAERCLRDRERGVNKGE
jgi:hypothetical protein